MLRLARLSILSIGILLLVAHPLEREHAFPQPIDAISFGVQNEHIDLSVSGWDGSQWSPWEHLAFEREDDPFSSESTLVLFSKPVSKIRVRSGTSDYEPHPIVVSKEPVHFTVAALGSVSKPRILSRVSWGADEEFLYRDESPREETEEMTQARSDQVPQRVVDCEKLQEEHPAEFAVSETVRTDKNGRTYLWPRQYSKDVRLLVVHHTALKVTGDGRSPVERLRAIYQYHAKNLGWGDIGYHYVIDETGQVYEGRSGGESVVGGHAYCYNVGTIGISLMGNFDEEKPSQSQMQSLQWLLASLADQYDIDTSKNIRFHGKELPPIVGHGDLMATACPGYYVNQTLSQIRSHVTSGDISAPIRFPDSGTYVNKMEERRQKRLGTKTSNTLNDTGISSWGTTALQGRPGSQVAFSIRYKAGAVMAQKDASVGQIIRSDPSIRVWIRDGETFTEAGNSLKLPKPVAPNDVILLQMKIEMPPVAGSYTVDIGPIRYRIETSGRRVRIRQ